MSHSRVNQMDASWTGFKVTDVGNSGREIFGGSGISDKVNDCAAVIRDTRFVATIYIYT